MTSTRLMTLTAIACLGSGCFLFHGRGDSDSGPDDGVDDASRTDGGGVDGPRSDAATWNEAGCPWVGIYAGCDDLCDGYLGCPWEDTACQQETDLCTPREWRNPDQACAHPFETPGGMAAAPSCTRADAICVMDLRDGYTLEDRTGGVRGAAPMCRSVLRTRRSRRGSTATTPI